MAQKDTTEVLSSLHGRLAGVLTDLLDSGEASTADLNVIRQFLKDNGIECIPVENNPMEELMNNLPDLDAVPLADL